jgi:4-oxalocrotonate tautomerase
MPHIVVKLHAGRPERLKAKLAEEVCKAVMSVLKLDEGAVSVGIEDIEPAAWTDKVYKPDILAKRETIYKRPGYAPQA